MGKGAAVALRYLQQVLSSNSDPLILQSSSALLAEISSSVDSNYLVKEKIVKVLQLVDQKCFQKRHINVADIKIALDQLQEALSQVPEKSDADTQQKPDNAEKYSVTISGNEVEVSDNAQNEEEENLDKLLSTLNLRQVPAFSPTFPEFENESDDDVGITKEEKEEQRAEKHGQKLCEEEVQKLPDGREVRTKKTKTVNVQQTSKHITISTRGGGCPAVSRRFTTGDRKVDEDNDEEHTDYFSLHRFQRPDPFERFRLKSKEDDESCMDVAVPGESMKTKSIERTSEISQFVSQKKEKNGRSVGENAASKVDTSKLLARQTESFRDKTLVDRKGEGTYEESSIVKRGTPEVGDSTDAPRKHVVEYIQTFGGADDSPELEYLRGSTISSYITLNDSLRFHEEQFCKKLQFEFSTSGASTSFADFGNLIELLEVNDLGPLKLPIKWAAEQPDKAEPKAIDWQARAAITYHNDLICNLSVIDYLVYRERNGNASEVRGGPRDALIVFATQGNRASLIYQEAFLVTYRTFISSLDLINKLVKRFLYMSMARDSNSQTSARNTFSVLVRVVDELTVFDLDEDLILSVTSFVYRLIHDGNLTFARILRQRLLDRIAEPFNLSSFFETKLSVPRRPHTILDFRSSQLASQLTFIDASLFHRIEPAELLWWAQEQSEVKSPNLVLFTEHFNNVSFWVRTQVLMQNTQKERERYFMKFNKVMRHLRKMSNFNSYLAVLSALASSPLARLEWNKTVSDSLKEHISVMDTSQSYKNYRTLLQSAPPPCVPYVGVVLQDLTFVHAGNPDKLQAKLVEGKTDLLNFLKRWHQYAILDSIRKLKKWNYDIKRDEKVLLFFDQFQNQLNEEETWARSHQIKAPQRKK
ncbi:unnamed protein product [Caenorhabditis auriculariae]|uniref:Ras-GEF domain-containing protein n=1 Tax=Caenorhabditis auriculariae TaxID=2777116 RepID=A0A8S1GQA4_9PELO|nr:unnamed protein product [Caenorhabditis auriculariae]